MEHKILQKQITIPVEGQSSMEAYMARPSTPGKYPAVIIGMALFGVTQHIRKIADLVAEQGYIAIAPGFYHRIESGVELAADEAGQAKGFELLHQVSRQDAVQDVRASMDFLKRQPYFRGRIGFLGFSTGGHIGYLAATQLDLAACALFYAGWLSNTDIELSQPEPTLTLTSGIAKNDGHILFFAGENDFLITDKERQKIVDALEESNVDHEMVVYPNVEHDFFCDERESFDQASRDDAWKRILNLFESTLRV